MAISTPGRSTMDAEPTFIDRRREPAIAEILESFDELVTEIQAEPDLDAVLHLVARKTCALVDCSRCSVYLRLEDSDHFRGQIVEPGGPDDDERIKRLVSGTVADGFTREILATRKPVIVRNAQADSRVVRSVMQAWNVRSMLGVPMVVGAEVVGILYLDDEAAPHPFRSGQLALASAFARLAGIAIVQARRASELRASLLTAARQNEILRHSTAMEERLTRIALEGATLGDVATVVSELTNKPCAIHDASFRRLAVGRPAGRETPIPNVLDDQHRAIPEVAKTLADLKAGRPAVVGPIPAAGLLHRFLVTPVVLSGRAWGYLALMEFGGRFSPLDVAASRHSATAIAFELSLERRSAVADRHGRQGLVRDLVNGLEDLPCLVRRGEFLGFHMASPHVVTLLRREDEERQLDAADVEAAWSRLHQPEPMWATPVPHGAIALLVELDENSPRAEAIAHVKGVVGRLAQELASQGQVLTAISSRCHTAADYRRGYDEAIQVLQCLAGLRAGRPAGVTLLAADDLGAGRLLLNMLDGAEADRFTRNALGPLLNGEGRTVEELLSTIRVFFDTGRSVRTSAKWLGVHENTIRYRLSRVSDLTGLDLAVDADAQLTAQVALLILRIQGRLPELRPEGERA